MAELAEKGVYTVPDRVMNEIRSLFSCGSATDEDTRRTILDTWRELDVLIDPHTAVAKHVLDEVPADGTERVCLSTASLYKFCSDVLGALGVITDGMNDFACMDALEQRTSTVAPPQLSGLRAGDVLHDDICDRERMGAFVESACARVFL